LIDTESSEYEVTQCWAAAFHAQEPAVQGIRWTSRQDDSATAVLLFGDRIAAGALRQLALPRELDTLAYPDVLYTASAIGVSIVDARL
jgi:DNA-binding LacI/PurR family transcriptional regulator